VPKILDVPWAIIPARRRGNFPAKSLAPQNKKDVAQRSGANDDRFKKPIRFGLPLLFAGDAHSSNEYGFISVGSAIALVLNVSGHRIGTARCGECARSHPTSLGRGVGLPELKGRLSCAVVTSRGRDASPD